MRAGDRREDEAASEEAGSKFFLSCVSALYIHLFLYSTSALKGEMNQIVLNVVHGGVTIIYIYIHIHICVWFMQEFAPRLCQEAAAGGKEAASTEARVEFELAAPGPMVTAVLPAPLDRAT